MQQKSLHSNATDDDVLALSPDLESGRAFKIAIVGSGPGGLSAAAHAAELGISYVLLESEAAPANTTRNFQKGKHVMAEPGSLPLRSSLPFATGTREAVIGVWEQAIQSRGINLRLNARVTSITGEQGSFDVGLESNETIRAEFVILAIGLQGNIRKLEVPGANHPRVQYQLDDPEEYQDETILVVGGGDAGVEDALALKAKNHVILVNRQEDFINCGDENFERIIASLKAAELESRLDTAITSVEVSDSETAILTVVANTPHGIERISCHRVIARLGAEPPRRLLDSFGIRFQSEDAAALPLMGLHAESSVPGIYIIGALGGHPLIKQAINQGYDVVECIMGRALESLDEAMLRQKLALCYQFEMVSDGLAALQQGIPHLAALNTQQLREFVLASTFRGYVPEQVVFQRNDYGTDFYSIARGEIDVHVDEKGTIAATLSCGQFFGEMGLISGRRRSATIKAKSACTLIETPRRTMLNLLDAVGELRRLLDAAALKRAIHTYLGLSLAPAELDALVAGAKVRHFAAGEVLFNEGDKADGLHLIRRGSVTVSRMIAGRDYTLSYVSAGNYVGEMALLSGGPCQATVRAAVNTETILLETEHVAVRVEQNSAFRKQLDARYLENMQSEEGQSIPANPGNYVSSRATNLVAFLTQQGLGEATDVLLIDYSKCIRCDNCVTACADTHGGTSRLDREAGPTYANIHVPTSCRHCEHPHCMKDCPPDALRRSTNGEVYITDQCIGCGNCVSNCPYGVIQLAAAQPTIRDKSMLGFLIELATGTHPVTHTTAISAPQQAVKCDMCQSFRDGPVCVRSCPTGAALRVNPDDFLSFAHQLGAEAIQL